MQGQRFGKLVVLHRAGRTKDGKATWSCRCDCGIEKDIAGAELRHGGQKSCGCSRLDAARKARRTHGRSRTALHRLWRNMINRCERPQTHNYHRYGGRGVTVCKEWRDDASAFIQWCDENGYQSGLQIDRRDNDRSYSPDNCRFVTPSENARNRSSRRSRRSSSEPIETA